MPARTSLWRYNRKSMIAPVRAAPPDWTRCRQAPVAGWSSLDVPRALRACRAERQDRRAQGVERWQRIIQEITRRPRAPANLSTGQTVRRSEQRPPSLRVPSRLRLRDRPAWPSRAAPPARSVPASSAPPLRPRVDLHNSRQVRLKTGPSNSAFLTRMLTRSRRAAEGYSAEAAVGAMTGRAPRGRRFPAHRLPEPGRPRAVSVHRRTAGDPGRDPPRPNSSADREGRRPSAVVEGLNRGKPGAPRWRSSPGPHRSSSRRPSQQQWLRRS
jgi:hypothetical protein